MHVAATTPGSGNDMRRAIVGTSLSIVAAIHAHVLPTLLEYIEAGGVTAC